MKTKLFLTLVAGILLSSTISIAQKSENSNPYAIFGSKPFIAGDKEGCGQNDVFIIENFADGSQESRLEHDTGTGVVKFFDSEGNLTRTRRLSEGKRAWLTQDRFAEKYYHLSPYSYAAGNPIRYIDINGDSIWYTINKDIITMHVTGNVINQSSSNINMQRRAEKISSGITNAFTGTVEIKGQTYNMQVDAQIGVAGSMDDVSSSDHLFVIADRISFAPVKAEAATSEIGGKVMTMHAGASTRTAIHEFGHMAGLTHRSATGIFNLMEQGSFGTQVTSFQRATMINGWANGKVNRGSNSFNPNPLYPALRIPNPYLRFERKRGHINQYGLRHGR